MTIDKYYFFSIIFSFFVGKERYNHYQQSYINHFIQRV